jgi:hypothetical protein
VAFYGNCPAWLLSAFFSSALPMKRVLSQHIGFECEQYAKRIPAFRHWLDSEVPIAGVLFRELIIHFQN